MIQQKLLEHRELKDLSTKWELIKLAIRNYTIPYCSRKKKLNVEKENNLNEEYLQLFNEVHSQDHVSDSVLNRYNTVKNELENIEKSKTRGIILRSKVKWVEEGEKNTSYFLRLERANYKNKHIEQLLDTSTRTIITEPEKILNLQKDFYQNLFRDSASDGDAIDSDNEFFQSIDIPKITNDEKFRCDKLMTELELTKALSKSHEKWAFTWY